MDPTGNRALVRRMGSIALIYSGLLCVFTAAGTEAGSQGWLFGVVALSIMAATLSLSATWAGIGPGGYSIRLVQSLSACGIVAAGGCAGVWLAGRILSAAFPLPQLAMVMLCTPLLCLILHLLYLALRRLTGWRIAQTQTFVEPNFSIAKLLVFTTFTAVAFGCLRIAAQIDERIWSNEVLFMSLIGLFSLSVANLLICVPAIVSILGDDDPPNGCINYLGFVMLCGVLALLACVPLAGTNAPALVFSLFTLIGGGAFFYSLPLLFMRSSGLRVR